jgi:hypothetical protein
MEVNSRPTVTSFAPDPATITVGQSTTFTVVASGGSSPVSVLEYSGLPVGCASSPSFTLQCQPSVPGTFAVSVLAADELGVVAGGNTTLTVNPASGGTGGGIRVNSFSAFPNPLELGGSTTLSVAASGGNGSLYYSYGGLPGGCGSANEASIGCVPSEPGNFTVTVAVQDDLGDSSWAELLLTVVPPLPSSSVPGGPSVIGFWASPAVISIGGTTVLQVLASGGTLPLSYLYEGLPQGCESASVSSLSCTPTVAGPFTVEVVVTDAAGNHGSSTVFFLVNSPSAGAIVPGVAPGTDLGWIGAFAPGLAIGAVAMLLAVFLSGRNRPPAAPRRTPNPNTPLAIPRAADRPKVVPASVEVPEGSVES